MNVSWPKFQASSPPPTNITLIYTKLLSSQKPLPTSKPNMPKEKSVNPVQAQHKADKARALKKSKATVQAQRTERFARRNPAQLQRKIDSLKQLEQEGDLRPHDRQELSKLEKELAAVKKAREALGDKAPQFGRYSGSGSRGGHTAGDRGGRGRGRGGGGGGVLGKRRRDGQVVEESSSDTDDDVGDIPMPRDTPPPIPRRDRPHRGNANEEPMGEPRIEERPEEPKKPVLVVEAAPVLRDLMKEATQFVPAAVRKKMDLAKGKIEGRLPEPEEMDELEKQGYVGKGKTAESGESKIPTKQDADIEMELEALAQELDEGVDEAVQGAAEAATQEAQYRMMEAEAKGEVQDASTIEKQLHHVEMEEVEDEEG